MTALRVALRQCLDVLPRKDVFLIEPAFFNPSLLHHELDLNSVLQARAANLPRRHCACGTHSLERCKATLEGKLLSGLEAAESLTTSAVSLFIQWRYCSFPGVNQLWGGVICVLHLPPVNGGVYTQHHKNVLFESNLDWPYTVAKCSRGYLYVHYPRSSSRGSLVRKVARAGLPGQRCSSIFRRSSRRGRPVASPRRPGLAGPCRGSTSFISRAC